MIEYRCRACRKLWFRARGLRYEACEVKCPRCSMIGEPAAAGPIQGEYECKRCGVHSFCERPPVNVDFCVRCGMEMAPVAKTRAPERADSAITARSRPSSYR